MDMSAAVLLSFPLFKIVNMAKYLLIQSYM